MIRKEEPTKHELKRLKIGIRHNAPASSERKLGKNQYGAVRGLSGRYDFLKFFPEKNLKWRGWGFGSRLKLYLVVDCPPRERLGN